MIHNQLGSGSRADPTGALATPYLDVDQAVSGANEQRQVHRPKFGRAYFFAETFRLRRWPRPFWM
jgi:hypothetical protein